MYRLWLVLGCSAALLAGADLTGVRTVYVMPMSRGLDQYLANRLATRHTFQVVTDPKLADAIFTDRIGENFQTELETIFPDPKPAQPKPAETAKADPAKSAAEKKGAELPEPEKVSRRKKSSDSDADAPAGSKGFSDTVNKLSAPVSSFGGAKGTIFLVDAKSRLVVWSTFDPSKGTLNRDLDRTASDIVSRLARDLKAAHKQ
jgi:hypothetical protein